MPEFGLLRFGYEPGCASRGGPGQGGGRRFIRHYWCSHHRGSKPDLNLIYRYDSASKRTTFASSRNLRYYGIAFDHQGSAFVSSHSTGTIEKYAVDGSRVTFASGMIGPTGLAIDGADQVFVADSLGHAIYRFDSSGNRSTVTDGLDRPTAVALDGAGNVYFSELGTGQV